MHGFVGQTRRGSVNGMTQKKQIEILDKFRNNGYHVLVATSVAEEGLDIPSVDLVVFYEPIPSEIRSIQRRGRTGRKNAGRVVVMMAKDTRDEGYYWASFHKEKRMGELVKQMKKDFKEAGQQSILSYAPPADGEKKLKIIADTRERSSLITKTLREKSLVEVKQLTVGDYLLSDRVVVERKTVDDFLQSLVDKRLLSQAAELKRNFETPIMILEGGKNIYAQRDIHPNAIRGALTALAVDFGISVLPSMGEEDTAEMLYCIAKREQIDDKRQIVLRGEKKPLLLGEKQRYIVESLPNVSAVLAARLLERFGSVEKIMSASKKELTEVEGIGELKADEIRKVVGSTYNKNA